MTTKTVNERQLEVLRWVVDGCPDRDWPDETHKTSARALSSRGLVKVSRRDGRWTAEATDAGRYYAAHGTYPAVTTAPAGIGDARESSQRSRQRRETDVGHRPTAAVSKPASSTKGRSRTHEAVRRLRDDPQRLYLRRQVQGRALRLLNDFAKEAAGRGHGVASDENGIRVTVGDYSQMITLTEPMSRTRHQPTDAELARQKAGQYVYIPTWDEKPSGRLRVRLGSTNHLEDPKPRKDGTTAWILEDRIGAVIDEVERAAQAAVERKLRGLAALEQRKRHWNLVREEAVERWKHAFLLTELRRQADAWSEVRRLVPYIEALARRVDDEPDEEKKHDGRNWVAYARETVAQLDPLVCAPAMPSVPEPTHSDLGPYMQGLSPWGP